MRLRLWVLLTALLLAVVVGDTVIWNLAEQRMRAGLADWVAARRATGWSVSAEAPEAGGWPLAATLAMRGVALQGGAPDIPDGLTWRAERVVLRLGLLHPLVLRIDAQGAQRLRVADAPDIPFTAGSFQLLVPLQADPSAQPLDLRGETLRADVPVAGGADAVTLDRLDVDTVLAPAAARGQAALAMSVKAEGVGLPSRLNWPLGPRIASIDLDAALDGPLPGARDRLCRNAGHRGAERPDEPVRRHHRQGGAVPAGRHSRRRRPIPGGGAAVAAIPYPVDATDAIGAVARAGLAATMML
jgi:hypothetical protein